MGDDFIDEQLHLKHDATQDEMLRALLRGHSKTMAQLADVSKRVTAMEGSSPIGQEATANGFGDKPTRRSSASTSAPIVPMTRASVAKPVPHVPRTPNSPQTIDDDIDEDEDEDLGEEDYGDEEDEEARAEEEATLRRQRERVARARDAKNEDNSPTGIGKA